MRRGLRFVPLAVLLAGIVEFAVFVLVGRAIGFGWTILLVAVGSLVGLALLRREGMRAWRGFRAAVEGGSPPGRQVTDGLVGLLGGILLAVPGLVTGVAGSLLVVPPVRGLARRRVQRAAERRVSAAMAGDLFGPRRVRMWRGRSAGSSGDPAPTERPPAPPPVRPGVALEGEIVEPHGH